jgi:SAM-dependent methyltransferase
MALADETSPVFLMGGFEVVHAAFKGAERTQRAFKSGKGVAWGAHDPSLFTGTARFFEPGYRAHLVDAWLPALDGVVEKLKRGAKVADVGCGHGISTAVMAKAFPNSQFTGFDAHAPSIRAAQKRAKAEGVSKNTKFEVAKSANFPGKDWDLVCFFDCFHDMGDPLSAAKHVKKALAKDGTWMLVEPFAGDRVEDNLNMVGRCFYAASAQICVMAAMSDGNKTALGAQAGEAATGDVIKKAGFTRFRRATQTPFNLILEARK